MARALLNDSVIEKVASLALGCCVAGGVLTLSTAVAPVVGGAVSLTAVLTTLGLKRLIRDKPECEKALTSVKRALAKDFIQGGEADEAAVKAAVRAFDAALKPEVVFTAEALTEALAVEARVVPALTGHVLADMAARDPRFEEAGLARDLAEQILTEAFKRSVEACPPFKDRANLVLAEVTLDEVRGLGEQMAEGFGGLHDHLERLEALMRGEDSPAIRKLRAELNVRMDELGIPEHERPAWLAVWVDEVIAAFDERRGSTNEGAAFDALRDRALELLLSNPDKAASPFLDELERDKAEEQDRQEERLRRRERLWEEAVEMEMLALRFDAAVGALWKQAAEQTSGEEARLAWLNSRAIELTNQAEVHPGLSRLLLVEALFRSLLDVSARKKMPVQWAVLQSNLGTVLSSLGERIGGEARAKALNEAVDAFRATIEIYRVNDMHPEWASAQSNLGIALRALGEWGEGEAGIAALNEAVTACRAALEVYARVGMLADWAMVQNNLGTVFQSLCERAHGDASLEALNQALGAYHAALEVYTRDGTPTEWAMTQNNLGSVLSIFGARTGGEAGKMALDSAVESYNAALQVYTRAHAPVDWAMTQNNLGNALTSLGARAANRTGGKALAAAVEAYRAALDVYTRADMPVDWAMTQNNLGNALRRLGMLDAQQPDANALAAASEAHQAALEVYTQAYMPAQWAMTVENLHITSEAQARTYRSSAMASAAADGMIEVIAMYDSMQLEFYSEKARRNRSRMMALCRELGGTCSD